MRHAKRIYGKIWLGLMLALTALPGRALAERVTVIPTTGAPKSGELVELVPNDHLTLRADDGQIYRIQSDKIQEIKPAAGAPAPSLQATAPAAEEPSESAPLPVLHESLRASLVQGLLAERVGWQSRYTGSAAPALLLLLGAGAIAGGIGLTVVHKDLDGCTGYTNREWSRCGVHPYSTLGAATVVVGGLSFLSGLGLLLHRTSDATVASELARIDGQLQLLGVPQAVIAPWLTPSSRDLSGGVQAQVAF